MVFQLFIHLLLIPCSKTEHMCTQEVDMYQTALLACHCDLEDF